MRHPFFKRGPTFSYTGARGLGALRGARGYVRGRAKQALQVEDGPAVRLRQRAQAEVRVYGRGPADDGQHRDVAQRVAVGGAVVEVEAVLLRVVLDDARLLGAGDDRR